MNYSRQREQILQYVKSVKSHPTAEEVYNNLKHDIPNLSLGTVYRNLVRLSDNKDILRIELANSKDRFDGDTDFHYHAICEKCGKIYDIHINYFSNIDDIVKDKLNCKVISHEMIFNVICSECRE